MAMTYTELCANIADITQNEYTDDAYKMFAQQTEQRIFNSVQLPSLRKSTSITATIGNQFINVPADFLAAFSVAVVHPSTLEYLYLLNKDVNFMREAYPTVAATGTPKYYAIYGNQTGTELAWRFLFGPTPDLAYSTELNYFYYPESIVTAGTTWLGENFDSALLNGALVEAIRFMKGEADMVKMYQDMYIQSITLLKNLGDGKLRQDAYRSGQLRTQVN
tara:strand:+ start:438 stop:1097 length:660 start_codon:yes stop_codon:yes gene_type:complete